MDPETYQTVANYSAAKTCLKIVAAMQPQRVEGKEQELVHIWAQALPVDLPAGTAATLLVRAYRTVSFPAVGDVCAAWSELKQQRLERNMEPPDPPREIATDPNAYYEYKKTYIQQIAWGIKPETAKQQATLNATQKLQITEAASPFKA